MNEQRSDIVPGFVKQEAFTTVKKGYDKQQVDEYIWRNHNQLRDSQERLSRSEDEIERLRRDLAEAREKATVKPHHEQVSERMNAILRIAEEEADSKRAQVEEEIQRIREESTKDSKRLVKDAEAHAERILGSAREQAQELVTSAKQESEQLRAQAQQEADRVLAEAEQRAQRIHDTADHRLATLTATHTEAVRRLNDMRATLGDLLDSESSAGPLEAGLEKGPGAGTTKPPSVAKAATPSGGTKPPAGKPVATTEPPKGAPAGGAAPKNDKAAGPAAGAGKADGAGAASKPDKAEKADKAEDAGKPDKPEASAAPATDEEIEGPSTVRLGVGPQASAVRNGPPRPQGFRYDAPSPEQDGAPKADAPADAPESEDPQTVVLGADSGITGVYTRPTGEPKSDGDDGSEGVRIVQ
ncbi:hypothetical protein J4H86_16945 [Spiractinospora alimapuensis]|uniref:DivIVA domain-containing protein n=1 Tax=Spiractinospora alimapuensis TaxID=2820884 RepID=UPI001F157741|nr:DivIVA domain-containing protein [Spiractinospora alimapuensis]QVQ50580.1 hypothetical protein J4H86_16945 [Spiractinospora alimapuensis]